MIDNAMVKPAPRLAVCMIVRNEDAVLARCLNSIEGLYDELCIVDTGSTDGTLAIARQHTEQVKTFTQCNDEQGTMVNFAMARNAALAMASSDWVLQIDADEIIEKGASQIVEHLKSTDYDRVGVTVRSLPGGNDIVSGRLFRRNKAREYVSLIHEYLEFDGNMTIDKQIVITNLPDKTNKESASERNMRLCRLMLEDDPENSRIWYYLGREYYALSQHSQAVDCFDKAHQYQRFTYAGFNICYSKAVCLFLSRQFAQAIVASTEAINLDSRYAEAYCLLGDIYYTIGHCDLASKNYHKAMKCDPPEDAYLGVQLWAYQKHPASQLDKLNR